MHFFGWSFDAPDFLLAGATVGSIMAGFITTNISIVVSMKSDLMDWIRRSRYYGLLIDYLQEALWSAIALAVSGLVALFLVKWLPQQGGWAHLFWAAWLGLLVWALCCFIRICRISVKLFKSLGITDGDDADH